MNNLEDKDIIGITALLVHAAKIDENYTDSEKKIILNFIASETKEEADKDTIFRKGEELENDSIQLLNYTNILKKNSEDFKYRIIECLWKIIISDTDIDQYESNLMRRICGLIYFSDKKSGEIKMKILEKIK